MDYFEIKQHQQLCSIADKLEYWIIDFDEKNEIPNGYDPSEYESKGFTSPCIVQDFPIRGKGVYLRIRKRRWRHKQTGAIIQRDFSFIADGSKFTIELSDFLKDASGYATRYHSKYSQLLFSEWKEITTSL
jgi:transposase